MKKTAFSLTEIVIVVVILGIVMAGIMASQDIIADAKVRTARAVTQTSNVRGIDDIALWLESTSEESFDADVDATSTTDNKVDNWYDLTPDVEKSARSNATQTTDANKPLLIANAINGLPAVRFDGTNDSIFNTTFKLGRNISIFSVATINNYGVFRRIISSYIDGYLFFGSGNGNTQFAAFYGTGGWNNVNTFGSDATLTTGTPYILSNTLSDTTSTGYINGVNVGTATETNGKPFYIHGYNVGACTLCNQNWDGYIGEIIIFNRAVTDAERKQVEAYLSKKWGIKVAG